jgi:hypothetical protein
MQLPPKESEQLNDVAGQQKDLSKKVLTKAKYVMRQAARLLWQ